ncbi:MAG: isoprenoid biosynthesis glyoxalase ElbB [Candidatus Delongbacteria bacterium]|nr:isoprenoid biosynthesis glyoxalase ElbB [Candidatus Delongbacteria bacterium]MCG2760648.1 isoprenoid biosynthesis glyoxalase ElbB [Candidatus Delongbacteria bacterium]
MKSVAVLLAGCGHLDGSEIQESVSTLLALSKYGVDYECFSVDMMQYDVMDHLKRTKTNETRNLLNEAARIARGAIKDISELDPNDYYALIIPGGFGIAKNLCTYGIEGRNGKVIESVKDIIQSFYRMNKYIGAICISPMMVAMALEKEATNLKITPGFAENAANDMKNIGAIPVLLPSGEICIDEMNNVISTPAYMNGNASLYEVYQGIEKLVKYIADNL